MIRELKGKLINIPGWHTSRKIVVIESDDWGSIRMNSLNSFQKLSALDFAVKNCAYNSNDRIENNEDLDNLANVLLNFEDKNGNPAKFTLNNIVANPDFDRIRESDYNQYFYESFFTTLERYPDSDKVKEKYVEGINKGVFQPQLHGREHVNVGLWMERLRNRDRFTIEAFKHNMFSVSRAERSSGRKENLDTYGQLFLTGKDFNYRTNISEAQELFQDAWKFKSESFIAPCYVWHPDLEPILFENGVKYIQGTHVQRIPKQQDSFEVKTKYHYTGDKNKYGQYYLVRNVLFEPTEYGASNAVDNALAQIETSFAFKKPAIISSHRVNYIGSLNPKNRELNLKLLKSLLYAIVTRWPEVEFMSSDELGHILS